jgi:hypothetical protein
MADDITDQLHVFDAPYGRKLDTPDPRGDGVVFEVGGLARADAHRLAVARANFPETTAEQYEQRGKDWIDRTTGVPHRIVLFDPAMADDPRDSGCSTFFVTEDGHLAYLRPLGVEGRSRNVVQGSVGAVVKP